MAKPNIHVAIAILTHRNNVLVGWREAAQHQGNKHEFPGGKVESGETPLEACRRETFEEVGVGLKEWYEFDFIQHEYDDVVVNLHLFQAAVPDELLNEIQLPWKWYKRAELTALNFPKANKSIIDRLCWQHQIRISENLQVNKELKHDQLLYWRVNPVEDNVISLSQFSQEQLCTVIVNHELWQMLNPFQQSAIAAVHLKQAQLLSLKKGDLQVGCRYIAACHDLVSMQHAQKIGCDAILLSPVCATESHPEAIPLGWNTFENYVQQVDIPVFALGGIHLEDLIKVQQAGGYGIAGIRFLN